MDRQVRETDSIVDMIERDLTRCARVRIRVRKCGMIRLSFAHGLTGTVHAHFHLGRRVTIIIERLEQSRHDVE